MYKYEEDTNGYYKDGKYYICKYLNVESSEVTIQELLMDVNVNIYSEEELQKLTDDTIDDYRELNKIAVDIEEFEEDDYYVRATYNRWRCDLNKLEEYLKSKNYIK